MILERQEQCTGLWQILTLKLIAEKTLLFCGLY